MFFILHFLLTLYIALGVTKQSNDFWKKRIKERILKHFEFGLTVEELEPNHDLRKMSYFALVRVLQVIFKVEDGFVTNIKM